MRDKHSRRLVAAAVVAGAALIYSPLAQADETPFWGGWYKITFHTDQKSGTSIAATQQETPYTVWYKITTTCSGGKCVASVIDGPTPKDNVVQSVTFDWTGSAWSRSNDWSWDCTHPDGTTTLDPANSVTASPPSHSPTPTGCR